MAQLTTPNRQKQSDRTPRSFGVPPKIDLKQLNLADVGADSPELILNRARYQATRENALAQQAETVPEMNVGQAPQSLQNNRNDIWSQSENDSTDGFETQSNELTPREGADAGAREKSPSKKKDVKEKENKDKKSANNKPNSQGGGDEKKDPGVAPQPLLRNADTSTQKEKTTSSESSSKSDNLSRAKTQAISELKNAQDKLKSGDLSGAIEGGVTAGGKIASSWALTTMWGAVWLDWTLLTLLGLNAYLAVSLFTDKIASFGEDYLFGKWMPKELAKWFEIILLALLDMIVLSIIFMILYGGYKLYTASFSDIIVGGAKGVWSGEGAATGAAKKILAP